jgi:hypothetical protein
VRLDDTRASGFVGGGFVAPGRRGGTGRARRVGDGFLKPVKRHPAGLVPLADEFEETGVGERGPRIRTETKAPFEMRARLAVMAETGMKHAQGMMETGTLVVGREPAFGDESALARVPAGEIPVKTHEILVPFPRQHVDEERRSPLAGAGGKERRDDRTHNLGVAPVRCREALVEIEDVLLTRPLSVGGEPPEDRRALEGRSPARDA